VTADEVIARLALEPHPEGGWYRQDWAAPGAGRPLGTAIWFLLSEDERSHWHRVDADELWLWHAGAALTLSLAATEAGPAEDAVLGPDLTTGALPRRVVPAGWWQAARPEGGWALVSCVVVPGFVFDGFELALPGFDIARR
jgi:predicted cupin superfamily sugar epimerase